MQRMTPADKIRPGEESTSHVPYLAPVVAVHDTTGPHLANIRLGGATFWA